MVGEIIFKKTGGHQQNLHALFTETENLTKKTKVNTCKSREVWFVILRLLDILHKFLPRA